MSNAPQTSRRSHSGQGSQFFWGILSVIFAAAACYFFWQNRENELTARTLNDQQTHLLTEKQQLQAQVDKLQSSMAQFDSLLKNREEKLQEQASTLAQATEKTQQLATEHQAQTEANEKIKQLFTHLDTGNDIAVVQRKDTPVLRISNTALYLTGEMTLKPEAQQWLKKLAAAVQPQIKDHALRLESFTDNDPITGTMKAKYTSNYELSGARAAAVARFLSSEAKIPADHIIVIGRSEQNPIASNETKDGRAKNRRLEILLEPLELSANGSTP
jgi:chemotaxis protein MotB